MNSASAAWRLLALCLAATMSCSPSPRTSVLQSPATSGSPEMQPTATVSPETETTSTPPKPGEVHLHVCWANSEIFGAGSNGLSHVVEHLKGTLEKLGAQVSRTAVGPCDTGDTPPGCFARRGLVVCRADDVGQLLVLARFAEEIERRHPVEVRDRRERTGAMLPIDGAASLVRSWAIAGSPDQNTSQAKWVEGELGLEDGAAILALVDAQSWLMSKDPLDSALALQTTELTGTFLMGHELYHALDERCPFETPAAVEDSGLWDFAVSSMSSNSLFCPRSVASDELLADRCGMRALKAVRQGAKDREDARAAKLAGQILASAIFSAHHEDATKIPDQVLVVETQDYLPPLFRTMLLFDELLAPYPGEPKRRLCDRIARALVVSVQKEFSSCSSAGGDVDDLLLDRLPQGVTVGWTDNVWSESSFHCGKAAGQEAAASVPK